jgi:hypothetical protein
VIASLAMTAILQPLLGSHTGLGARLQKSVRKLRSSLQGLQKAVHCLQKISTVFPESRIINGLRANAAKKIVDRAVGRTWSRAAEANGPARENAFRAPQPGQLRIPLARLVPVHPGSRLRPPD